MLFMAFAILSVSETHGQESPAQKGTKLPELPHLKLNAVGVIAPGTTLGMGGVGAIAGIGPSAAGTLTIDAHHYKLYAIGTSNAGIAAWMGDSYGTFTAASGKLESGGAFKLKLADAMALQAGGTVNVLLLAGTYAPSDMPNSALVGAQFTPSFRVGPSLKISELVQLDINAVLARSFNASLATSEEPGKNSAPLGEDRTSVGGNILLLTPGGFFTLTGLHTVKPEGPKGRTDVSALWAYVIPAGKKEGSGVYVGGALDLSIADQNRDTHGTSLGVGQLVIGFDPSLAKSK